MLPIVNDVLRAGENRLFRQRKSFREQFNINNMNDNRFKELFRITKALYFEFCRLLTPHLHQPTHQDKVSVHHKILVALHFYATGSYQRCIGGDFNLTVSQTIAHRYIHEVTRAIHDQLSRKLICFPTTWRDINRNKEIFMERFNFPGIILAVYSAHIAILKPQVEEHNFINRKRYHSLNTQIICDADIKILSVNASYPGSTHDSFIWRQLQGRQHLLNEYNHNMRGCWLIGDSGYPIEPFLMTHYSHPEPESPESRYNQAHIAPAARNTVERTIGLLKMRFRCLLKERVARYEPNFVGIRVNTCASLHKMCLEFVVDFDENIEVEDYDYNNGNHNNPGNPHQGLFNEGRRVRTNLTRQYFN